MQGEKATKLVWEGRRRREATQSRREAECLEGAERLLRG
jgi:hypothetical protein